MTKNDPDRDPADADFYLHYYAVTYLTRPVPRRRWAELAADIETYRGSERGRLAKLCLETLEFVADPAGIERLTGRRPTLAQTGLLRRLGGATSRADGPGTLNRSRGHNAVLRPIRRPDVHP